MIINQQERQWRYSGTPYLRLKRDDPCYAMARSYIVHRYRWLRRHSMSRSQARDVVFDLVFGPSLLTVSRGVTFHVPEEEPA